MNEEKFRMLRERLLESLEEYREIGDQEIYQRIDERPLIIGHCPISALSSSM